MRTRSRHVYWVTTFVILCWAGNVSAGPPVWLRAGDLLGIHDDRILHIDPQTGKYEILISTLEVDSPFLAQDFLVDVDGTLLILARDTSSSSIIRFDPITGQRSVVSSMDRGDGPALTLARSLALSTSGLLYIASRTSDVADIVISVDPTTGNRQQVHSLIARGQVRHIEVLADDTLILGLDDDNRSSLVIVGPSETLFGGRLFKISSMAIGRSGNDLLIVYGNGGPSRLVRTALGASVGGPPLYSCFSSDNALFGSRAPQSAVEGSNGSIYLSTWGQTSLCESESFNERSAALLRRDPNTGSFEEVFRLPRGNGGPLRDLVIVSAEIRLSDADSDDVPDAFDNCASDSNPLQSDLDEDGIGDACNDAEDYDGDEYSDALDVCPFTPDPDQTDRDLDGLGDACDPYPDDDNNEAAALAAELNQTEAELETCRSLLLGDEDADGVTDSVDQCPGTGWARVVDHVGCSKDQFCAAISETGDRWRRQCFLADWMGEGDEEQFDCRGTRDRCISRDRRH